MMDPSCQDAWDNVDKDRKVDFIRSCRGLAASETNRRLRQFSSEDSKNKATLGICGTAQFLDSPD